MKHLIYILAIFFLMTNGNKASKTIQLFNGKNLNGWHMDVPAMDSLPNMNPPFIIRNGNLVSLGEPRGHLITNEVFMNYRLTAEYRFVGKPGNCGVLVHASTSRALYQMFPQSIEVQMEHTNAGDFWAIMEDITCENMEERRGPKDTWGISEGKNRRIINLTDNSEHELGDWNIMKIECLNDKIKVWVNDNLVNYGYHSTTTSGHIAVQAEGAEVEFKRLELVPITNLTD